MATDFDLPIDTTAYSDVWEYVRDNITDVATWFDSITGSNIPTNAKRFNVSNRRFEYFDGATWLELLTKATTAYDIRAAVADLADLATNATTAGACTGNSATASLANNSLSLGGSLASTYTQDTDIRPVAFGGTGSNTASGARNNLEINSQAENDGRYLIEANNLSDLTSAAVARANLDVFSEGEGDGRYLLEANNLSDLTSVATAQNNLNVYSQSSSDFFYLNESANLSDVSSASTSRVNLGLLGSQYTTTTTSVSGIGSDNHSAPTGYQYCSLIGQASWGAGPFVYPVYVSAVSGDGATVTTYNEASTGTHNVKIIWKRVRWL